MDNLTHSLFGVAEGLCAVAVSKKNSSIKKTLWVAVISNNLPDLDLLYSWITGGKLGYLLHHRGHTHTVAFSVGITLLFCLWQFFTDKNNYKYLSSVFLVGLLTHLGLDALNVYGVHPFWPLSNVWIYGDTLFIVEPTLWIGFFLYGFYSSPRIKVLLGIAYCGIVVLLFFVSGLMGVITFLLVTVLMVGLRNGFSMSSRHPGRWLLMLLLPIVVFSLVSRSVELRLKHRLQTQETLEAITLSPFPSNPFCWTAIVTGSRDDTTFQRLATVASFPKLISVRYCPAINEGLASLSKVNQNSDSEVLWRGEYIQPKSAWQTFASSYCQADAYLRFARNPFFFEKNEQLWMGDLRFDYSKKETFSVVVVELPIANDCPSFVPSWGYPRYHWLGR